MPVNTQSKFQKAIDSSFSCLQCEVCKEVTSKPLPGLCPNHMFCEACVQKTNHCPVCKSPLKEENLNVAFKAAAEILPVLTRIKEHLNKKSSEVKSNVHPDTEKIVSKIKTDQEMNKESPTSSKSSSNRRSSMGSAHDVNKRNKKGETLLHVACNKANITEVKRLLNAGARCATKDYAGWTPLHEVAQHGRLDIARLLLEHGAKVNATGGNLNTPLHDAAQSGNVAMIKLLLEFGALPDQHNLFGETPREIAESSKNDAVLALMAATTASATSSFSDDSDSLLSTDQRQIVVMEAGLDRQQKSALVSLSKTLNFQLASTPTQDVRLVITSTKNNICETSAAVLTGLALGAWIVNTEWLDMCIKTKFLVDPEPFEVYGTVNHTRGEAPKESRKNAKNLMPGLFAGCHIYFGAGLSLDNGLDRNTLSQIVRLADGQVLSRSPDPEDIPKNETTVPFHAARDGSLARCSHYIIYQKGHREPQMKYNMKHVKSLPHTWLISCIENFALLDP